MLGVVNCVGCPRIQEGEALSSEKQCVIHDVGAGTG